MSYTTKTKNAMKMEFPYFNFAIELIFVSKVEVFRSLKLTYSFTLENMTK